MTSLPVVWIDAVDARAAVRPLDDAPSDDARRALDGWARARGLVLSSPVSGAANGVAVDVAFAERVEQELDRAREATAGLDGDGTDRALSRAGADVVAHPELPQAAWLMAEIDRAWAVRYARIAPVDVARSERLWREAAGLDGGRASGIGEPRASTRDPSVVFTLVVPSGVTARIDGVATPSGAVSKTASAHAVVAERDGVVLWASWVNVTAGMTVTLPPLLACTTDDLSAARIDGDRVDGHGARCGRWVAAAVADDDPSAVRVATCEESQCGPLVEWRILRAGPFIPGTEAPDTRSRWPAWATWTIVGVGAAGAAVAVVLASGAFKERQTETQFVNGGLHTSSFGHPFELSF
jgi:hypothetical protein